MYTVCNENTNKLVFNPSVGKRFIVFIREKLAWIIRIHSIVSELFNDLDMTFT